VLLSSYFFTERVVNIWNCLPSNTVDFSSLTAFISAQLKWSTSAISSTLHNFLRTGIVSLTFVLLMFLCFHFILFYSFSMATISAVLVALSHMLFVLLARRVLYVFLANK